MAAALDAAVASAESLLTKVCSSGAAGAQVSQSGGRLRATTDPDDAWCDEIKLPAGVYKERDTGTGYWMTKPFETQCPMPGVFKGDTSYLKLLSPVIGTGGAKEGGAGKGGGGGGGGGGKGEGKGKGGGEAKPAKDKAAKGGGGGGGNPDDPMVMFDKASLAVGRVAEAAPAENSDKLYVCQVDCGEDKPRQVVTGLRKHVAQDVLQGALVMVILNLKPAKLAGIVSEAMILCGTGADGTVALSAAPPGAAPGERVTCGGAAAGSDPVKQLSSKIWDKIKPELKVAGGVASYNGAALGVGSRGAVAVPGMPDGAAIS